MINGNVPGAWIPFENWTPGEDLDPRTSKKALAAIRDVSVSLTADGNNINLLAEVLSSHGSTEIPLKLLLIDMFTEGGYARQKHMLELRKLRQTLDDIILAGEYFQEQEGKEALKKARLVHAVGDPMKTGGIVASKREPKNRK